MIFRLVFRTPDNILFFKDGAQTFFHISVKIKIVILRILNAEFSVESNYEFSENFFQSTKSMHVNFHLPLNPCTPFSNQDLWWSTANGFSTVWPKTLDQAKTLRNSNKRKAVWATVKSCYICTQLACTLNGHILNIFFLGFISLNLLTGRKGPTVWRC